MNTFWDRVWKSGKPQEYTKYIDINKDYSFISYFKKYNIIKVCDAACGFGKYSVISRFNGFKISGFDIVEKSVELSKKILDLYNLDYNDFIVSSITDISFQNNYFDGTIAHSVLDHLRYKDAKKALSELKRITKSNGLIYVSFDGLEKEDLELPHIVLDDGSLKYTAKERKGMIFRHYEDKEIRELFNTYEILMFKKYISGVRDIIVKT